MSKHLDNVKIFITMVFKGFVMLSLILLFSASKGFIPISPLGLAIIWIALLLVACVVYIISDVMLLRSLQNTRREEVAVRSGENAARENNIDVFIASIVGSELATMITKNSILLTIFNKYWHAPIIFSCAILFYYVLVILSLRIALMCAHSETMPAYQHYQKMLSDATDFLCHLIALLPHLVIMSLLLDEVATVVVASNPMVCASIAATAVLVCMGIFVYRLYRVAPADNVVLRNYYVDINIYSRNFLIKLITLLVCSAFTGLLVLHTDFVIANATTVIAGIAGILLGAAAYTTYCKLHVTPIISSNTDGEQATDVSRDGQEVVEESKTEEFDDLPAYEKTNNSGMRIA